MPWCDDCAKFWNPNTLPPDGTCPSCGRVIGEPPDTKIPWHFWILIIGTGIYLAYRAFQGFEWLVNNNHTPIAIVIGVVLAAIAAWVVVWRVRARREEEPVG